MTVDSDITCLLSAWQGGDEQALERLSTLVYKELRRLAQGYAASESPAYALEPAALIDEALARLAEGGIDDKHHRPFRIVAASTVRRALVDHARSQRRLKRGGGTIGVSPFADEGSAGGASDTLTILELHEALRKLADVDPRMAESVELVYFGALSVSETAALVNISESTLSEDLRFARAWLAKKMGANDTEE